MSELTSSKTFFGHPRQLSTLFHIELWERFSFYGMQGILFIYLYYSATKGGLGFSEAVAGGGGGGVGGGGGGAPPPPPPARAAARWPTASGARNAPCFTRASSSCAAISHLPSSPAWTA